jgi:hypothetical protein
MAAECVMKKWAVALQTSMARPQTRESRMAKARIAQIPFVPLCCEATHGLGRHARYLRVTNFAFGNPPQHRAAPRGKVGADARMLRQRRGGRGER